METREGAAVAAEQPAKLSPASLVPIGTAVAVGVAVIGGLLQANARLSEIEFSVRELSLSAGRIERGLSDYTTRAALVLWIEQTRSSNPTLKLPELPR